MRPPQRKSLTWVRLFLKSRLRLRRLLFHEQPRTQLGDLASDAVRARDRVPRMRRDHFDLQEVEPRERSTPRFLRYSPLCYCRTFSTLNWGKRPWSDYFLGAARVI
jgi:hypothetical protein